MKNFEITVDENKLSIRLNASHPSFGEMEELFQTLVNIFGIGATTKAYWRYEDYMDFQIFTKSEKYKWYYNNTVLTFLRKEHLALAKLLLFEIG
jgi:hypothetical protein